MYRNTYPPPPSPGPPPPPPPPQSYGYERYDRPPQPSYPPPGDAPSRQWNDHYTQDRRDDYQFRGPFSDLRRPHPDDRRRANGDYRDRDRDRDHDRDRDNYHPPQGDFTFQVEAPPGIESYDSYDSYRPREREQRAQRTYDDERPTPHYSRRDENARQSGRNNRSYRTDDRRRQQYSQAPQRDTRPGRQYRTKPKPSARLLLLKKHDGNSELMLGDTAGRATYRDVDELSDSDEAEMDISDNSDSEVAEPANKRARTSNTTTKAEQDAPRWSNPDPYTALPPPDESSRKKKDMVQLIRKARVEAEAKKPAAQIEGLDFISCDFSDDVGDAQSWTNQVGDTLHTLRGAESTTTSSPHQPPTLPLPPSREKYFESTGTQAPKSVAEGNRKKPIDLTASTSLGNRKRTFNDSIKLPHTSLSLKPNKMRVDGDILPAWRPKDNNPCPWAVIDHSKTLCMSFRLHKEVIDFYRWACPRVFEERVREDMVFNLMKFIQKRWPDIDLYPFGSFMSGLYLPTADMDIAICSHGFLANGTPKYDRRSHLYTLQTYLEQQGIARHNMVEVISKAKVPLVKYTDCVTYLKVDLSFEKMDGRRAIQTFLDWKSRYPAMPMLVAIVKQFLLMRGLNEPVNGGIGGFSVICMVVNLLNQMPQVQSYTMTPEFHLGELLMEFFDYYGNHFQFETVAIRMKPPGLISKSEVSSIVYRNMDRISILDPNNPQNDISGGSKNSATILKHFSQAHSVLKSRMADLSKGVNSDKFGNTILGPLFGGNYSSFLNQREHLRRLAVNGMPAYDVPEDIIDEWA
ncbi:hypothetical protein F4804DRAFT_330142 [Jackrogersella minutella]|nr:hypothetical protein F4804DRAFT_330142 [Jackrogersella minutella]